MAVNGVGLPSLKVITHQTHNLTAPKCTSGQIVTCTLTTLSYNETLQDKNCVPDTAAGWSDFKCACSVQLLPSLTHKRYKGSEVQSHKPSQFPQCCLRCHCPHNSPLKKPSKQQPLIIKVSVSTMALGPSV